MTDTPQQNKKNTIDSKPIVLTQADWSDLLKLQLPEILFDLQVAACLVPMNHATLRKHLSRHKREFFPVRYRRSTGGRRIRLLTGAEICRIRSQVIQTINPDEIFSLLGSQSESQIPAKG